MVQLLWIKTAQNLIVLALSIAAFVFSLDFYKQTQDVVLPEAPKAT